MLNNLCSIINVEHRKSDWCKIWGKNPERITGYFDEFLLKNKLNYDDIYNRAEVNMFPITKNLHFFHAAYYRQINLLLVKLLGRSN